MAFRTRTVRSRVYLDWASAAPVVPAARRVFEQSLGLFGNPSAAHTEGRLASELLMGARTAIARLAEVKPEAVLFTSGATESNNLAIQGTIRALQAIDPTRLLHILYLPTAHASIIDTLKAQDAVRAEPLVLEGGAVSLAHLKKQVTPDTVLVCMDAVCGETGTRWDTRGVRRTLDAVRPGIALHVDASQLPLSESFEQTRLAADLVTLDAQKVGGVRGIGVFLRSPNTPLAPFMHGGGQEQGLRSGTEPVALAAAFAAALESCGPERAHFAKRAESMRLRLIERIQAAVPDAVTNEGKEHVPHILNLSFPGRDTDYAVALLDKEGFAVSTRSACETDSAEGSRVVLAFTGDASRTASTLRVSWGPDVSAKELDAFSDALIRTIRFLDTPS